MKGGGGTAGWGGGGDNDKSGYDCDGDDGTHGSDGIHEDNDDDWDDEDFADVIPSSHRDIHGNEEKDGVAANTGPALIFHVEFPINRHWRPLFLSPCHTTKLQFPKSRCDRRFVLPMRF